MAMMTSTTGTIYSAGSGYSVQYVKKPIEQVKEEIKDKISYKYFFYVLIHDELKDFPSTIAFGHLLSKFGELIGDNGWVIVPMGEGFKRFQKEISELKFKYKTLNYISKTPDVSIVIHDYPLDLYKHYPEHEVAPTLLLKFPSLIHGYQEYIDLFSQITYAVNNGSNLFELIKNKYNSVDDIIDCSAKSVDLPLNSYTKSYSDKYLSVYKEVISKFEIFATISNLIYQGKPQIEKQIINDANDFISVYNIEPQPIGFTQKFINSFSFLLFPEKKKKYEILENKKQLKNSAIQLICEGETEEALKTLFRLLENEKYSKNYETLVLKQNQFSRLMADKLLGILSYEQESNALNRINNDILIILRNIEDTQNKFK